MLLKVASLFSEIHKFLIPVSDGLLDSYVSQQPIQAKWTSITPSSGTSSCVL